MVGTPGHTALLAKKINGFASLEIIGFVPHADFAEGDAVPAYPTYRLSQLDELEYDAILVSSYEYNFELEEQMTAITDKPVYAIYDNTSRSFAETLTALPSFPSTD